MDKSVLLKKKGIVLLGVFILLLILVAFLVIEMKSWKYNKHIPSVYEQYFSENDKECVEEKKLKKMSYQENQIIEIEDYSITLQEVLYEKSTISGYCKFAVKRKNTDMRTESISEDLNCNFGGKGSGRFRFAMGDYTAEGSCAEITKTKATKDTLYVYFQFYGDTEGEFTSTIKLFDDEKVGGETPVGIYQLKPIYNSLKYSMVSEGLKRTSVVISPFAILIKSEDRHNLCDNLCLKMKDGSIIEFGTKNHEGPDWVRDSSMSESENMLRYGFYLNKVLNINDIVQVRYNGYEMKVEEGGKCIED